ncbi:head completion/stabilization protein [Acinetobacter sp. BWR-L5]|uniref:head completion/stabilization protein n=1 Tax=Acinetobacter sp. BWR-L5 TaxID=2815725 RepID=UPI0031FED227
MLLNESVSEQVVQNPEADRPNVSITDLLGTVRLDKSKGQDLLAEKITLAMDMINDQVLLLKIETEAQIRKYKRAVCYEAAALICEDNLDFDTTTTGQSRGENQQVKTQSLRRVVNHTIADLTNQKRNRIKLV